MSHHHLHFAFRPGALEPRPRTFLRVTQRTWALIFVWLSYIFARAAADATWSLETWLWWVSLVPSGVGGYFIGGRISKDRREYGNRQREANDQSGAGGIPYPPAVAVPNGPGAGAGTEEGAGAESELEIPDSVEPIIGWRRWLVRYGMLSAMNSDFGVWSPKETMVATHRTYTGFLALGTSLEKARECDAPESGCQCGIYALKDLDEASAAWLPQPLRSDEEPVVFGRVSLWGRVIEAEKGYRAQYAYPKGLWVPQPSFKRVQAAVEMLDDIHDQVREAADAVLEEERKAYVKAFHRAKVLVVHLAENYGVPVHLFDPDREFSEQEEEVLG